VLQWHHHLIQLTLITLTRYIHQNAIHLPVRSTTSINYTPLTTHSTGASGYVGGQLLHQLTQSHPEYNIVTLVRDSHAAETVSQAYPKVRTVVGDLDDSDLVKSEAEKADIVLSMYQQLK